MGPSLDVSIVLVALAPFLAAAMAPVVHRFTGSAAGWILAVIPASIFLFLLSFLPAVAEGESVRASLEWAPSHDLALSFFIDGLSLMFALTISGVGTLIIIYSGAYLAGHEHQGRFLGFMLAFMGAMLGLVLADSTVALFTFWELTSITSFLLIGFDHHREAARRAATQALVITNLGGLALLLGAVLLNQLTGHWDLSAIRAAEPDLADGPLYGLLLAVFLVAAFTKSAQFPLQFWLPNAMEAPTPVSAFLHSATMVQAGVYLLARMSPVLGDTGLWTVLLMSFGGVTLLWGAVAALKQTDLKQMLAQTTVASLGLLVMLIGIGSEAAIAAMVVYFVAHALYKAGLFMLAGTIDHETGTRDITALGGLRGRMPVSFVAAVLAGVAMLGLPFTVGYLAKEEMYLALQHGGWNMVASVVMVLGNALLGAVGIVLAVRPFLGHRVATPKDAHEGSAGLLAGPVVLGIAGIGMALATNWFGHDILVPAASAILAGETESHLTLALDFSSVVLWVSVATWLLALGAYLMLDRIRTVLRRMDAATGTSFDTVFDVLMFGLIRGAGAVTRFLHHGRLEIYMLVLFAGMALALLVPALGFGGVEALLALEGSDGWPAWPILRSYEWAVVGIAVVGLVALVVARNRLVAILSLGVQGIAVAMLYLLFGAADLSFTQFMVEVLSVVILALVMTRLKLDERDQRPFEDILRDGTIAVLCGVGVALTLMIILAGPLDMRLTEFYAATSVPIAHGHNIVNVILVDYRGFDTLGEITVVMTAGIAILALIRSGRASAGTARKPVKRRRRREAKAQ